MKVWSGLSMSNFAFVALLVGLLVACDNAPRSVDLMWVEPVQLSSGETVQIRRHVNMLHERAFGGGAGSAPVYRTSTIEDLPGTPAIPVWDAPLVPIVLDRDTTTQEWIIVASEDGCGIWERNGRPRPPYWAFRLRDGTWYRDEIPASWLGRPANLLVEYDVTDTSATLQADIESRKRLQVLKSKHAHQYSSIDANYVPPCSHSPSERVGEHELDLKKFGSLK
jgi:hypothetical protein